MVEKTLGIEIPIDFVEQLTRGRCIVFAGPGISVPGGDRLGPPGTAQLALELAARLGGQLDNYDLPWVAQLYAEKNGSQELRDYVAGRLKDIRYRLKQYNL